MTAENEAFQTHKKQYAATMMENEKLMREQEEHKSQSMPFTNCMQHNEFLIFIQFKK